MDDPRKFAAPEFVFGWGAVDLVGQYAANFDSSSALIVSDPGVKAAGHADRVARLLEAAGVRSTCFTAVSSNPKAEEVMMGARTLRESGCELVVAVGGGSAMDAAKAIGVVHANRRHVLEFEGVDRVDVPGPPLICIPTTAGTASDVSQFAMVTNAYERLKVAIISKSVIPDAALIDPEPTLTQGPELTAATGMDALAHAVEAYVSTASSALTDLHALEAVRLLWTHLPMAVADLGSREARSGTLLASLHAGLAFSNASLGLVHAMSHSLGGYLDLPHGECNAVLLEHVVETNYDAAPERYDRLAEAMGLATDGRSAAERRYRLVDALNRFRCGLGLNRSLSAMGVTAGDLPVMAVNAMRDPCLATNPSMVGVRDIEALYAKAL